MRHRISFALAALLTLGAATGGTPPAGASDEIAAREPDLQCATCHVAPPRGKLNDRGIYYQSTATLDGYEQLRATFGSCAHCHVRKPGSKKLTRSGKRFQRFVGDMDALREWLESMHPPFGADIGALRAPSPPAGAR